MGWLGWLGKPGTAAPGKTARRAAAQNSTQFPQSQSGGQAASPMAVRKDLLRVVLRETLSRNGIPVPWLSADMLRTASKGEDGLHVRLLVRHWDPRLLEHGLALERDFQQRLLLLDPQANSWLKGFSWQFSLDDDSDCPPLPHPGSWTAPPPSVHSDLAPPSTAPADIISGPVVIPRTQDDVRADLERLLALRDADQQQHGRGGDGFAPTRPVKL